MRVAGFGFRNGAQLTSLLAAYEAAGGDADALATLAAKADHPAMQALAETLALPLIVVHETQHVADRLHTSSQKSLESYGTGSVAESTALAAAGDAAYLAAPRAISPDRHATCAIAIGET